MKTNIELVAESLKEILTDKPQSRERLCWTLQVGDRTLRRAKEVLVSRGVPVCSNSETKGYYMGGKEEVEHTIKELRARAYSLLDQAAALEHSQDEGQISWRLDA